MKVIVISGASSNVGKTTLARNLQNVLEGSCVVKIGHGKRKPEIQNHFYQLGTPFSRIREDHAGVPWLVIESNAVLREVHADMVVYLEGKDPKPSAEYARDKADIISGQLIRADLPTLAARLGITVDLMRTIVRLSGDGLNASESGSPP